MKTFAVMFAVSVFLFLALLASSSPPSSDHPSAVTCEYVDGMSGEKCGSP